MKYYYVEIRGDDHEVVEEYEITDGEAGNEEEAERVALARFLTFRDYKAVCIGMEDDGHE